jgi:hypothetical protein
MKEKQMNKLGRISKGVNKQFAAGGRTKMFGAGDRVKSKFPAEPQRPGRTGQHATKAAPKRRPGRAPVDQGGDMGGTGGSSQPRRPAA